MKPDQRKMMINRVLENYEDLLDRLLCTLRESGSDITSSQLLDTAFNILDKGLSDDELGVLIKLEGPLNGRFPGVQNRIRELLLSRVAEALKSELH